jgi:hypothetical protein
MSEFSPGDRFFEESDDSPLKLLADYERIKELVEWLIHERRSGDPSWMKNRCELNSLLLEHRLPPDDPDCFNRLMIMVAKATNELDQK